MAKCSRATMSLSASMATAAFLPCEGGHPRGPHVFESIESGGARRVEGVRAVVSSVAAAATADARMRSCCAMVIGAHVMLTPTMPRGGGGGGGGPGGTLHSNSMTSRAHASPHVSLLFPGHGTPFTAGSFGHFGVIVLPHHVCCPRLAVAPATVYPA